MSEQKNVFQAVMEGQKNPQRVKNNTTHLVFYLTENENNNFVYALEEDEYYFKKNVITLNYREISDFEEHFKNSNYNAYKEFLENTVDSHNLFEIYKKDGNKDFYSMILKLYIKIPSLYLSKSVSSNELQTLKDLIEKKLIEEELFGFTNQLNKDIDKYLQSGKELENIDVDTDLDIWIGENDNEK
jgi:RecA-family ATPase